jgi:sporulation protein YlmC with PRC-barrel domain
MRIDLDARVVNKDGAAVGRLHEIVFDRESRRVAGFLVVTEEVAPREVLVMVGQVAQVEQDRLDLTLSDEEVVALPDVRQHLFVAPDQDLEAEVAAAESATASPDVPDPGERPRFSAIPGIALTPNLFIPLEVERTILGEGQVALGAGLRILTAAGEEVGQLGGVVVNDEAQLEGLVLAGGEDQIIDFTLLDELDEDANELTLRNGE